MELVTELTVGDIDVGSTCVATSVSVVGASDLVDVIIFCSVGVVSTTAGICDAGICDAGICDAVVVFVAVSGDAAFFASVADNASGDIAFLNLK